MQFPFAYGDVQSGSFSATSVNEKSSYSFEREYHLEIDATGTLELPGNRVFENVIRMKTEQKKIYTTSSFTTVSYKWYCKDLRYPLLSVIGYEKDGAFVSTTTAYYSKTLHVEEEKDEPVTGPVFDQNNFRVYPNPFGEQLKVDYTLMQPSDVEISIYDNSGRKIRTETYDDQPKGVYTQTIRMDKKSTPSGVLYLRIKAGSDVITESLIRSE